ncbi:regulator of G-protein signaling 22 [Salarias fasciatus]|uniref:regulator of G-protein signaling 22 n=1 Tax=Salarias fasciatus TaxID=181472 RepID=UPI0011764CD2|nr:regulator of G-protein signaling 22 [Salarias fasciatus]
MCGVISAEFSRLTADSFESSLAADPVLLHHFNDFLSLPCFPESLMFNQRSGLFEVVSGAAGVVSSRIRSALLRSRSLLLTGDPTALGSTPKVENHYTVHCLDTEEGIQWIKRERLPFFFQSDCYHEYRLEKLLLQWDPNVCLHRGKSSSDRATRSAPQLRPSQFNQTTMKTRTRSYSEEHCSHCRLPKCEETQKPERWRPAGVLEEGRREPSLQMFESLDQQLDYLAARVVTQVLKDVQNLMDGQSWANTSGDGTNCPSADKSPQSSVCQRPADNDRERSQGEKERVQDGKRGSAGEQAEWDWKNGEVESRGTRQEKVLDICCHGACCQVNRPGLEEFREFLRGTPGEKLINLWMDTERLKATQEKERKNRHLAVMRSWYLTSSSHTCLNVELLSRLGLTTPLCWTEEKLHSVQSCLTDSLLHYWTPRFLFSRCVQEDPPAPPPVAPHTGCSQGSTPPPVPRPETCWSRSYRTVHTPEDLLHKLQSISGEELSRRRIETMLDALCAESRSGFYFTHFCEQSSNQLWVNAVYFWTDLQHYHELFYQEGLDAYRVQREAQLLYFTYICGSARRSLGGDERMSREVYDQLSPAFEDLFDGVEEHALQILLEPWTLLVDKDQESLQQVCVQEEVRRVDSQEFRELTSLYEESERQLKQQQQRQSEFSSSSITPSSSSSKSHRSSESWSRVSPEYQGYRLGSLLRHRHEIGHFMSFLKRQEANIHLRCWLDLEQYRRTPRRDGEVRRERSRHICSRYLNTKYFFSPDSPATAEQQAGILQMTGGLERLKSGCLSKSAVEEIRDIVRTHIERTWLPLFLSSAEFTERQEHRAKVQAADGRSHHALRRRRARREGCKAEGLWMSSSKEILLFRRVLLNPVTCQLFQHFVSLKGDFLENDVLFWLEVQRYKDLCHSHSDETTIQHKISTIISCFISSSVPPALQIDIPPEQAQHILEKRHQLGPYIFREAQMSVFSELLKLWPEFEELRNSMEEEQLRPLLQEKRVKYRARVRRQRRKEEEEEARRRAQDELESPDSSCREEEEMDYDDETEEEQDGGSERKLSRTLSKVRLTPPQPLSWSYSKYMAGLKKEEVLLRKQSQTPLSSVLDSSSSSSCSLPSLQRSAASAAGSGRRGKRRHATRASTSLTRAEQQD